MPAAQRALLETAQRQATPEAATGRYPLSTASGRQAMVVTAHPLATEAALKMLRAGGSAADAAVAAQAVLGLVEPQSSGFGGGSFILHAVRGKVTAIDGRETAPAAATPARFLDANGAPLGFDQALAEARAVGVPGTVAALAEAHKRWGRLPWARLLEPAIHLAESGFPVSDRLARLSAQDRLLAAQPSTSLYFFDSDGKPWAAGRKLRNPALAFFLRSLALRGPAAFYNGSLAEDMVKRLRLAGSDMTLADWSGYRPRVLPGLCRPLDAFTLCSAPPPAGGLSVLESLLLWRAADTSLPADHALLEAERLAFADRQRYSADPGAIPVPVDGLLAPDYVKARAALITAQAAGVVEAGTPAGAPVAQTDRQVREQGTSHLAIVDAQGQWLAMTSSIEDAFGSRLMLNGMLMNNQLTDFSFQPEQDGRPVANRVAGGKRPRSAMSPSLVLDAKGQPVFSAGSPGGSRIIGFTTGVIARWLQGGRDAGQLVSAPQILNRNGVTDVEVGYPTDRLADLRARGHQLNETELASGLGVILRTPRGLQGAADPRREGRAAGY